MPICKKCGAFASNMKKHIRRNRCEKASPRNKGRVVK